MRIEVVQVAGPVPVRRQGVIDLACLAVEERRAVQGAVDAILARGAGSHRVAAPVPDVGCSIVTIVDDEGTPTHIEFSDAEATDEQARLLKALRPFLKIVPW
jgi:hypothetical protein